jgi:hypothetical protein
MSNRWMLNGSVTLNSATYNAPPAGFQDTINGDIFGAAALPLDPTNRDFTQGEQTLINGKRWTAKLSGLYQLRWGVNVAGTLNARQGFAFIPNLLSPNRGNGLGTIRVMVEPYAATRYDNLVLLDFKAEKRFSIGRTNVIGSVDVFNVTNTNTVLARERARTRRGGEEGLRRQAPDRLEGGVRRREGEQAPEYLAAGRDRRGLPRVPRLDQGPADDPDRRRHPLAERRTPPDARPVRMPQARALVQGRALSRALAREGRHGDLPREYGGHLRRH